MPHYEQQVYDCQITGQCFTKSKTKGTPGFFVEFQPEGGKYARKIDLWLTEKTVDKVVEWLLTLGISVEKWSDLDPSGGSHVSLVGIATQFECKHEPSQDGTKTYEKWELPYTPKAMEPPVPMEAAGVRSLDRLFGAAIKPLKSRKAAPAQAAKPKHEPVKDGVGTGYTEPATGDDIPFVWLLPFALAAASLAGMC